MAIPFLLSLWYISIRSIAWATREPSGTSFENEVWEPDEVRVRVNANKLIQVMLLESNEDVLRSFLHDFMRNRFEHLGLNWTAATVTDTIEQIGSAAAIAGGDKVGETSYAAYIRDNATNARYIVDFRVQLRVVASQLRRLQAFACESLRATSNNTKGRGRHNNSCTDYQSVITVCINTETLFHDQPGEFVSFFSEPRYGKECLFNYVYIELDKYRDSLTRPLFRDNVEKWLHFIKFSHLLSKTEIFKIYSTHPSIMKLYDSFFEQLFEAIVDMSAEQMAIESEERKKADKESSTGD